MILRLPLPPSPNRGPSNPFERQRAKDVYRKKAWVSACAQHRPLHEPPARVRIDALFWMRQRRDEDNLNASLKGVLDALRQKQQGAMRWREGLWLPCGYFVDDDPEHLNLGDVWQEVCSKDLECVVLEITDLAQIAHNA